MSDVASVIFRFWRGRFETSILTTAKHQELFIHLQREFMKTLPVVWRWPVLLSK